MGAGGSQKRSTWAVGLIEVNEEQVKIALANGLNRSIVYKRIYAEQNKRDNISGEVAEEIINKAITMPKNPTHAVKGKYTPEDVAEALANGIGYKTFISRVFGLKWSVEKAKTDPVKKRWSRTKIE